MTTDLMIISALPWRLTLLTLKYSFTRLLSVDEKSRCVAAKVTDLDFSMLLILSKRMLNDLQPGRGDPVYIFQLAAFFAIA